ncbi:MAG: hypothetical protein O3B73_18425, partial [bacterium]|nr:hypothetical protein [bacterium]
MHRVILALYLLAYALLHSLLAVDRVKKSLRPVLPTRYYRIAYSLLSVLLLLPIPFLPWPEGMVYRIGAPAAYFFHLLQAGSFVGFLWTLR